MEALKMDHIKTVLFILRIIDKEESYVQSDAFTPYTLTLACARAQHVPAARDGQNRNTGKITRRAR
jgi:hypothetical protein